MTYGNTLGVEIPEEFNNLRGYVRWFLPPGTEDYSADFRDTSHPITCDLSNQEFDSLHWEIERRVRDKSKTVIFVPHPKYAWALYLVIPYEWSQQFVFHKNFQYLGRFNDVTPVREAMSKNLRRDSIWKWFIITPDLGWTEFFHVFTTISPKTPGSYVSYTRDQVEGLI